MNTPLFNKAKEAYAAGDYATALQLLTSCLQDAYFPPLAGEAGLLYHQIGNCLVKLGNHTEAINAYTQAAADVSYGSCGAVNYNLGMSYAALGDFEDAVSHFEIAVSDGKYDAPYKAYLAMGNALMKLGKSAEAGIAFRAAALDEHNPNPARALLNLGVCFMALNRPADAVVSYESALQFDMDNAVKNKLYANLGQAYVSCNQMQKACHAFEQALADKTYFLSDSASVDYQRAVGAVAQGMLDEAPTAVLPELPAAEEDPMSGFDVMAEDSQSQDAYAPYQPGYQAGYGQGGYDDGYGYQDAADGYGQPSRYRSGIRNGEGVKLGNADNSSFFQSDDVDQWEALNNAGPAKRHIALKIISAILALLVIAVGVGIYFYTQGWGYPSQETVVAELFADPEAARDTLYADGLNDASTAYYSGLLIKDKAVVIDGVNKSMSTSTVYATTTLTEGGKVTYEITLIRDMLTWKVSKVEIYHPSKA